jgi:hypothetical protein
VASTLGGFAVNTLSNQFAVDTSAFSNPFTGTFTATNIGSAVVVNYAGGSAPVVPPVLSNGVALGGGQFRLSFSGPEGQSFRVLGTNVLNAPLTNWPVLMSGAFGVGGPTATNFIDTTASGPHKFDRIASP